MMRVLALLLIAQCLRSAIADSNPTNGNNTDPKTGGGGSAPIDGKCEQGNGFEKVECGEKDKSLSCCSYKQQCVGPIKPKEGDDRYECSKERKLTGHKAMKIVLVPLTFMMLDILIIVYMVIGLNIIGNHITKLCVAVVAISWPLLMSSKSHFGIYSAFLAILVAQISTTSYLPRLVYRLVWVMMVFQVILLFGPNEVFHVPFFEQSQHEGNKSDLFTNLLDLTEADCDKHYGNFFKVLSIEKQAENANPDVEYYGFCTEEFLGFVQGTVMLQGIVWMAIVLMSTSTFLPSDPSNSLAKSTEDPLNSLSKSSE